MTAAAKRGPVEWNGRAMSMPAWCREPSVAALGITPKLLWIRLAHGWTVDRALTTPVAQRVTSGACIVCGELTEMRGIVAHKRIRCEAHREGSADAIATTRYEDDPEAQRVVAENPEGASLDEVARVLGVSREGARLIERSALEHMVARCALAGISREDLFDALQRHDRDPVEAEGGGWSEVNAYAAAERAARAVPVEAEEPGPLDRLGALLDDVCASADVLDEITRRASEAA